MSRSRVVIQRVVSANGKIISEAKSTAIASGDGESTISQSVTVKISSSNNSCSSSSTCSSTYSS